MEALYGCVCVWVLSVAELLSAVQMFSVESRYCHIIQPVRVLPGFVDRMCEARQSCALIASRLQRVLDRPGPVNGTLRKVHAELNKSITIAAPAMKDSEDMREGGFGIVLMLCKRVKAKMESVAKAGPKYTDLILMENDYFLSQCLEKRQVADLKEFVAECAADYEKVGEERENEA